MDKKGLNLSDAITNMKPHIEIPKGISLNVPASANPFAGKEIESVIPANIEVKIQDSNNVKPKDTVDGLSKKNMEIPKISFTMPKFSLKGFFNKDGSGDKKRSFLTFSGGLSWKESIVPTVLILTLTFLVIINSDLGKMLNIGNDDNTETYNQINASIPRDEIEALIKTKDSMNKYDNVKTSLTVYEIWNFLSRIIPKTNASEVVSIREAKITVTYTDSEFLSHLRLQNTLELLKKEGLIKSYKSEEIQGNTGDDLTTFYTTTINLDAGIDKDVGIRKVTTNSTKSGSNTNFQYRAINESDRGSSTEASMIKLREFLDKYSKNQDPTVSDFLQFKR